MHDDPHGYRIEYADDGKTFVLIRLTDEAEVGRYKSREVAIKAAEKDRPTAARDGGT